MAYGDPVRQQQPQQQQQPQLTDDQYYDSPGYYPGDMWAGKPSQDHALQVKEALYGLKMPTADDYMDWVTILSIATEYVARIPGIDSTTQAELNRDLEDIIDRSNSQGRSRIVVSKMQKFIFKIRSLVSRSDTPTQGLSGIGSMITNQSTSKQEIRMPQQQAASSFWPWSRGK